MASFISQLFILSLRGDTIISRDYRHDVPKASMEVFFRKLKFWSEDGSGEEAPPIFIVDGVSYLHVKAAGLLVVATSRQNLCPSLVLELLQRIVRVVKDYCGVLNEDALRKNFVLVYELLDEMVDFGLAQGTSTEALKQYVFNEPVLVEQPQPGSSLFQSSKRMSSTAVQKSVLQNEQSGKRREEVFVDVIEKLSVTFNSNGYILTSEIDGTIQMKSYLTGNPPIKVALSEDLSIANMDMGYGLGGGVGVHLDDCNFHEAVKFEEFQSDRTLTLTPPEGEFALMNYRTTREFKPPFRIYPTIDDSGGKVEVLLKLRADFPSNATATTVVVTLPLPKATTRVSFDPASSPGMTTEFKESAREAKWSFKKMTGGTEVSLVARLSLGQGVTSSIKKEIGPIALSFVIPMHCTSKLQVRYLQIMKKAKNYQPYRWVRYLSSSNSYVIRV
mmetsp:Transcript_3136/g.11306  ORF Transcript_3136/g.11306 Transcript_3136/m.11306 type:complete len:445 (+) Transcript_3136:251-1585(+)|eukprot:scaffold1146_cov399-Prasinococcus_capsulatus_cf.AAC.35